MKAILDQICLQVYLEQMTMFNKKKWTDDFTALIGAFDVEEQDLFIEILEPSHGAVFFDDKKTTVPNINDCGAILNVRHFTPMKMAGV